jgi:hypothetical protein
MKGVNMKVAKEQEKMGKKEELWKRIGNYQVIRRM